MNPETTIRPWLLACSLEGNIGAVEAFEIAAPDMSGKEEEIYFVYTVKSAKDNPNASPINTTKKPADGVYDVVVSASQNWKTIVEIELHNSQNGLSELAGCFVAAQVDQDLMILFSAHGIEPVMGSAETQNLSTRDGARIYYKHRMVCHFQTIESFSHKKINHRVGTVVFGDAELESGD
jgi:hypothetical protein